MLRNLLVSHRSKKLDKYGYLSSKSFSEVWNYAVNKFSIYREYAHTHALGQHCPLEQFRRTPPLTRGMLSDYSKAIAEELGAPFHFTKTGGTSGSYMLFPVSEIESQINFVRCWHLRRDKGVNIDLPLIRFWGRSESFKSFTGRSNIEVKSYIKKILFNEHKISSYDLSNQSITSLLQAVSRFKKANIILYGSHLELLLSYFESHKFFPDWTGKTFIFTSDSCSADLNKLSKSTGGRFIGEYGSAETGVISYSSFGAPLLYDTTVVNLSFPFQDDRLFRLNHFGFPLINYSLNDSLVFDENGRYKVNGKKRPVFHLSRQNGIDTSLSSVVFDHIIKEVAGNYDWQYLYNRDKKTLEILLICDSVADEVVRNLRADIFKHTSVSVSVDFQARPVLTSSGKRSPYVVFTDRQ